MIFLKPGMILSWVLLLSFISPLHASIGSNTAVSLQTAYALFPYSSTPTNQLLGFTAAQQGIVIGRSDTTAQFSNFFPVSTLMDMRSGTLYLHYDLTLDQTVSFISTGSFIAAGASAIHLPPSTTPLRLPSAKNLLYFITAQTQATAPTTADFSFDGLYVANANGQTMQLYTFNGSTLTAATNLNPANAAFIEMRWHPSLYYLAEAHQLSGGTALRTYLFTPPATLTLAGGLTLSTAASALAFSPNGLLLGYAVGTDVEVATFNTGTGALTNVATLLIQPATVNTKALDWIDDTFFVIGSSSAPQLRVYNYNGTTTITQAATSTPGNSVTAVAPARFGGYVGVGLTGGTTNIRVYQWNGSSAITQIAALNESVAVNSMDWSPTGSFLAVGLATSSTESQIRVYYFDPISLTLTVTGQVSSPSPTMNDIRWGPNAEYVLTADSNTAGTAAFLRAVSVYQLLTETTPFVFYNTKMIMNSAVQLGAPFTFQGLCSIEGNDNTLDLSQINNFSIAHTSTLLLKDMTIQGIANSKINFVDNTGVLQLQNVTWLQTNTYTFNQGALQIIGDVMISGSASPFIYQSSQPLTINSNSTLLFDQNMTFSYAPSSNANTLLTMTDITSIFSFNPYTTLNISKVGMQLTNGTFVVNGPLSFINAGSNSSQGLIFGNGTSAANNCTIRILAESGIILDAGFLTYNNV